MAKLDLYGPLKAVQDLHALLRLFEDKDFRKEVKALVDGIEGKRRELNDAIETYGKCSEIDALRAKARAEAAEAERALAAAKTEAREIKERARTDVGDAKARLNAKGAGQDARDAELSRREGEITALIEKKEAEFKARDEAADTKDRLNARRERELKTLKKKYKDAIGSIKGIGETL